MIKGLTLILGGVRSGKSSYAISLAKRKTKSVAYIATAEASDCEMGERIKRHKKSRPKEWKTIEGKNVISAIKEASKQSELIIVDCLTIFFSNLMFSNEGKMLEEVNFNLEQKALKQADVLMEVIKGVRREIIIVSSETGSGVVPAHLSGRLFRDTLGLVNQRIASQAEKVYFMIAGIPVELKELEKACQQRQ